MIQVGSIDTSSAHVHVTHIQIGHINIRQSRIDIHIDVNIKSGIKVAHAKCCYTGVNDHQGQHDGCWPNGTDKEIVAELSGEF